MKVLLLLVAGLVTVLAKHVDLPEPYNDFCILENKTNKYDPNNQYAVPWRNISLDLPANERWVDIATEFSPKIKALIQILIDFVEPIFPDALTFVDSFFGDMAVNLPQPYKDEITSISESSGVPLGQVVVYNIFYEIFTVCTSIIAQDKDGHLYHARNLDFGLFLGWNPTTHEWPISSVLRTMVINVNWIKDGKILYKSNNFAGYIGIYNGMKQGMFTITANERFQAAGGYLGMYRWMTGADPNGKWMSWLTRETLEEANSFAEAKDRLMNLPMLSPVYYILSGVNPYEGVIIARSLDSTALVTSMDAANPDNSWYLLETNYDQNLNPLYLDDRRTPGRHCMGVLGQENVGFQGIYNVLSSRTNLNKLTTYTVLMNTVTGAFETHLQSCPGFCWPF